jgi:hypothetical protein
MTVFFVSALGLWPREVNALSEGAPQELSPPSAPQISIVNPKIVAGEITTPRFRILYTRRSEVAARKLAEEIEPTRDYFSRVLSHDWPGITEIRLGLGREEFEELALPGRKPRGWAAAIAYPAENIILLEARSLTESDGNTKVRHELCHVALARLGGDWPAWFHEGLAKYLTGERHSMSQYATLFRAVHQDRVFSFEDLSRGWPEEPSDVEIAYAQSVAFVDFLIERHGLAALHALIDGVAGGQPFETEFAKAFRSSLHLEETAWRQQLPSRYSWIPILTSTSTLWALLACICIAAFLRLSGQLRRRRTAMQVAESAAEIAASVSLGASNDDLEQSPDGGSHTSSTSS